MFSTIKGAARVALAATVFCALSLTASAQAVSATWGGSTTNPLLDITAPTPPTYCIAQGTTSANDVVFTFTPPSGTIASDVSWRVAGDFVGVSPQGQTGNSFTVRSGAGFGKMRVTVTYLTDGVCVPRTFTCAPNPSTTILVPSKTVNTRSFDFFKTFPNSAWNIKGPTCLPANNPSVVYSVDPALISTTTQIQSGVGTDNYDWTVTYTAGGNVAFTTPGDGSAIVLAGDDPTTPIQEGVLTGSFIVNVKVGKCNLSTGKQITVNVATPIAAVITNNTLTCKPIGSATNAGFTIGNQNGVTYTLTSIGGLIVSPTSIASSVATGTTAITVSGITNTNTGSVIVTAVGNTGTCFGNQTVTLPLTRVLAAGPNVITPTCVTPSTANTIFTLFNAPVGQNVTYTLSGTGWVFTGGGTTTTNATGTVSVTTGAGQGTLSATVTPVVMGCTSPTISQVVKVRSPGSCSWTIDGSANDGSYRMVGSTPACYPTRSSSDPLGRPQDPAVTYSFTAVVPAFMGAPGYTDTFNNRPANFFDNGLGAPYPPGTSITATVLSPLTCLFGTITVGFRPAPGGGGQPNNTAPASQRTILEREDIAAFPNPADGVMKVELARVVRGDAHVTLLDATGRVALQQTTASALATLDTRTLSAGLYTLRVRLASGNVFTQHVSISH